MITICQTGQAFLTTILADRLFGAVGLIVAFVLNVIVFFVLAEALPKTWAVQHSERGRPVQRRPDGRPGLASRPCGSSPGRSSA